jgi:hypothetical protein
VRAHVPSSEPTEPADSAESAADAADTDAPTTSSSSAVVDIADLKRMSIAELQDMAEELTIANHSGLRKQDLIFRIEQTLLDADTVLRRGRARDPARGVRLPAQPGLELPLRA